MENIFENLSDSKKLNHLDLMVRSNMDKLFDEDHPVQNNITLLTKETFPIFCKLAFSYSFKLLKSYAISKSPINFENLETLFKIYNTLFSSIKRFNNREMLRLYLKHGTIVIKLFNQKYLPMFDKIFVDNKSNIQALFRNFQHSTRMLQHICRHAKVLKETSLMNSIPNLKKLLETFIYRVMLDKNKCADAFWIGHLKNRDIYGHEVMSQTTSMDD
ncbi:hypothetical protein HZS_5943 [Henneguya salminicola]|nr:hypothetical protein HZS_5943 [Henneguya salminicola]